MDSILYLLVALVTVPMYCVSRDVRASHCDVVCDDERSSTIGICGSDGVFYQSNCEYGNAKCLAAVHGSHLRMISQGSACVDLSTDCDYAKQIRCVHYQGNDEDALCGSDGKTYDNLCHLVQIKCLARHHNLTVDHKGPCPLPLTNNSREVDCSKYIIDPSGFALESDFNFYLQVLPCPKVANQSVCAFDHRTYDSECDYCGHLVKFRLIKKENLTTYIKNDGYCHNH